VQGLGVEYRGKQDSGVKEQGAQGSGVKEQGEQGNRGEGTRQAGLLGGELGPHGDSVALLGSRVRGSPGITDTRPSTGPQPCC
jgi:hypothetical protein